MKVGVIIPTKDRPEKLRGCLESVISQKHQDWEALIVEAPNAEYKVKEILEDIGDERIRYFIGGETPGRGVNIGWHNSKAELLTFIGDDDLLYDENSLSARVKVFEDLKEFGLEVLFTTGVNIDDRGRTTSVITPASINVAAMLKNYYIHSNSMMFRNSIGKRIGYINNDINVADDQEFKWRLLMECCCLSKNIRTVKHLQNGSSRSVKFKKDGVIQGEKKKIRQIMYQRYKGLFNG